MTYNLSHLLAVNPGDGSTSRGQDISTLHEISVEDGRGNHDTYFDADDVEYETDDPFGHSFRKMQRLYDHQIDMWGQDESRSTQNNDAYRSRYIDTFGTYMELTDYQRSRTQWITDEIEETDTGFQKFSRYSDEKVLLVLMVLVCREDGRILDDQSEFQDLAHAVELGGQEFRSIKKMFKKYFWGLLYPE